MFAQDFAFYHNGVKLENNAEINVTEYTEENDGTTSNPEYNEYFESNVVLHNESPMTINGAMTQEVILSPQSGYLSFCFGNCVLTNSFYTLETSVAPTNTTALHLTYFVPKNMYETVSAKYSVYNKLNPTVVTSVTITYVYTNNTAVNSVSTTKDFNVYQTGDLLNVKFNISENGDYSVHLYSLTGSEIYSRNLSDVNGNIKVAGLSKGIYFAKLKKGNQLIATRKVMMR